MGTIEQKIGLSNIKVKSKLTDFPGPAPESTLARRILEAHPRGHICVLVHGEKGVGKSVYALKVMWEVFEAMGYDTDTAFKMAMDRLFFRPRRFLDCVYNAKERVKADKNDKEIVICVDDAGVGLGRELYRKDQILYYEVLSVWQALRTYATCVILTTPEPQKLAGALTWNLRVHITIVKEWNRMAKGYPEKSDPLGLHRRARRQDGYDETYSTLLPDRYYNPYNKRRIEFGDEIEQTAGHKRELREKLEAMKIKRMEVRLARQEQLLKKETAGLAKKSEESE